MELSATALCLHRSGTALTGGRFSLQRLLMCTASAFAAAATRSRRCLSRSPCIASSQTSTADRRRLLLLHRVVMLAAVVV